MNKVLHVITGLGIGGAEHMLLKTTPYLDGKHVVCSLTNDNTIGKKIEKKGVKVYYLGLHRFNILAVIFRFRKIIITERPRIINSYLVHSNIFARVFGRLFGVHKIICSVRNIHKHRFFLNLIDRLTQSLVDIYTPNSEAVREHLVNDLHLKEDKMIVIPNFLDPEFQDRVRNTKVDAKKEVLKIDRKHTVLTYVASFKKQKGHPYLLRAFCDLPEQHNCVLLLVGDGKEFSNIKKLARELKIHEEVRFLGNRNDVPELLAITDIFVFPSLHEGMPNALIEAAAVGLPIICTNIKENKEVVNKDATLVPTRDPEAITKAIGDTLTRHQINRKPYNKFSRKATLKLLNNLYARL